MLAIGHLTRKKSGSGPLQALYIHRPWSSQRTSTTQNVCWNDNTAGYKQSRRLLECSNDKFLPQMIAELTRKGSLLDLIYQQGEAHGECKDQGSLGCSYHGGVQDSEGTEEVEKQAHNTCFQERCLWLL